jgi:hypothetical protein
VSRASRAGFFDTSSINPAISSGTDSPISTNLSAT